LLSEKISSCQSTELTKVGDTVLDKYLTTFVKEAPSDGSFPKWVVERLTVVGLVAEGRGKLQLDKY
jgi:hypothetical protein